MINEKRQSLISVSMIEESETVTKKISGMISQNSGEIQTNYNLSPKNYSGYIFAANSLSNNYQKNSQAA